MRTRWIFCLFLLIGLLMPSTTAAQQPPPSMEPEYASVGISPSYQEATPGSQLAFTVNGSSSLGGTILITVDSSLILAGDPICYGPCQGPFVRLMADATIIEVTLNGDNATVGFNATVRPSATIGDSLNINVVLVGGPQAVEMASAAIYVTGPSATQSPSLIEDNRMLFLETSPPLLRLAPGGDVLFLIQPARWGMWSGPGPDINLEINVPAGLAVSSKPYCGRGDIIPTEDPCKALKSEGSNGDMTFSINPGYSTLDDSANGVYLVLLANADVEIGSSMQVSVSAWVDDDRLAEQPQPVTSNIQIVSKESLVTPQVPNTVGATLEAKHGFTKSGATCTTTAPSLQFDLYEYGVETKFSTEAIDIGHVGKATDGSDTEVCFLPMVFNDVPPRDLYVLATSSGDDFPCRACVYGLITTGQDAEAVFPFHN